jgi:hypothetical protein
MTKKGVLILVALARRTGQVAEVTCFVFGTQFALPLVRTVGQPL